MKEKIRLKDVKYLKMIVCLSCLWIMGSCDDDGIPFENIPHTRYWGLKGKVAEMQISAYRLDEDHASENRFNIQDLHFLSNICCLQNILDFQYMINIYSDPINEIKNIGFPLFAPQVSTVSCSFTKDGYISDASFFWENKKLQQVKCKYNDKNQPTEILYYDLQHAMFTVDGVEYRSTSDFSKSTYTYEKSKITKSYYEQKMDTFHTFKSVYQFFPSKEQVTEVITTGERKDSASIFLGSDDDIYKIEYYHDTKELKEGQITETLYLHEGMVYKILPHYKDLIYDESVNLIEDKYYTYSYYPDVADSGMKRGLWKSLHDKKNNLHYEIRYSFDDKGNWIQMEMKSNRKVLEEVNERISFIESRQNSLISDYYDYESEFKSNENNYNYLSSDLIRANALDKMEQALDKMREIRGEVQQLEEERKKLISKSERLVVLLSPIIVRRNIIY